LYIISKINLLHDNTFTSTIVASLLHLYLIHGIIMLLAHTWLIYPLGHIYAEPEPEVQAEQAQVKASTDLDWDQGKSQCI
jgi:hypothetical protein